ncbi:GGDEF domain-containing protein [Psychrobacter sp. B38]|uniref:putative bifunctional diguanylate cyclase/phosphodiesterase n=1 Tax=Psychrobacter sp. B38 TaxID=3143538 RepID=UPI00320FDE12
MPNFKPISNPAKQQLLAKLCEQLDDAIFILDANFRYLAVNASYEMIIGYSEAFILGRPLGIYEAQFLSEEEKAILSDIIHQLDHNGFYENHFSMPNRYGQTIECHSIYRKICIEQNHYYVCMVRDVSAVVKDQRQVAHLLNYDQLTGLPNRKVFLSLTSDLLLDSYQEIVIVRLNIDRYRSLTSLLGSDGINTLIKSFATRVKELKLDNLRCFSHFGGEDFALVFECNDANMVRHQLDSLMQMCERPLSLDENEAVEANIYYHISAGVSYFPKNGTDSTGLLSKAEKALHYVKQQGGDDICWYNAAIEKSTDDSLKLETELRAATIKGEFVPYYQPKFELATGIITGFEALVRWQHPTRGLLTPTHFINAILTHKLSFELFSQMAIHIVKQLSIWKQQGFCQHICINADAAEFSHPDFFEMVNTLFVQYNISEYQLHIEVTESSLIQRHANVKKQLNALKDLGIFLALDDFGTGYASLSYLQEYPFDFIKIDKSFITNIETDRTQHAIVKAILDLAVALDMQVIAEGIETESQRDILLSMGCRHGQGYWLGKPVTAEVATEMLIKQYESFQ